MIESVPSGLIMVDASGRIVLFNRQAEEMFGYDRSEVVGRPIEFLLPERYRAGHGAMRSAFTRDASPRRMGAGRDLFAQRKDDSEFAVEVGLNPVETPDGTMVIAAVVDISERKRAEQQLLDYARELERSNQELERFASVASHDLKEPLRKITTFAQRLEAVSHEELSDRSRDYVRRMCGAAERMQALINDLLAFSRASSRDQRFSQCDLGKVAREALSDLDVALEESGGRVEIGELPQVTCDRARIRQVLFNLFANAIKFRREDTPPLVTVSATADRRADGSREWLIRIADNGIGIDSEHLESVFEIFHRLHGRNKYEGTGIGLALCRKIIERHGGSIHLESAGGEGVTAVIRLAEAPPTGQ